LSDFFAAGCDGQHRLAFSGAVYTEVPAAKPLTRDEARRIAANYGSAKPS
jgi:hypothetical protein